MDEELLNFLKEELKGAQIQATRVERVALERGVDADGNPALFVNLTLTDPPAGKETWPVDDVRKLRRLVRDAILKLLQDDVLRWYVSFEPATADFVTDESSV